MPVPSRMVAPEGLERRREKVSSASAVLSALMAMATVLLVSPGAKVSLPEREAKSSAVAVPGVVLKSTVTSLAEAAERVTVKRATWASPVVPGVTVLPSRLNWIGCSSANLAVFTEVQSS